MNLNHPIARFPARLLVSLGSGASLALIVALLIHRFGWIAVISCGVLALAAAIWLLVIIASHRRHDEACQPEKPDARIHLETQPLASIKSPAELTAIKQATREDISRRLAQEKL